MKIKLDDELEKKVVDITGTDYTGLLELNDLENIIKDLITEYHNIEEKLQDQKEYCDEWHTTRKVDMYDECGVSERDFV